MIGRRPSLPASAGFSQTPPALTAEAFQADLEGRVVAAVERSGLAEACARAEASTLRFIVPGDPQPKQRARRGRTRDGSEHWYTPDATSNYRDLVRMHALAALQRKAVRGDRWPDVRSLTPRFAGSLCIFVATDTGDGDNFEKSLYDALQGVLFRNDKQVRAGRWSIAIDRANPRIEVEIQVIGG